MIPTDPVLLVTGFLATVTAVSIALAVFRFLKGPTRPDRVVAVDLITSLAIVLVSVYAVFTGDPAFLDVAVVLALVAFLATVALARFVEKDAVRRTKEGDLE